MFSGCVFLIAEDAAEHQSTASAFVFVHDAFAVWCLQSCPASLHMHAHCAVTAGSGQSPVPRATTIEVFLTAALLWRRDTHIVLLLQLFWCCNTCPVARPVLVQFDVQSQYFSGSRFKLFFLKTFGKEKIIHTVWF